MNKKVIVVSIISILVLFYGCFKLVTNKSVVEKNEDERILELSNTKKITVEDSIRHEYIEEITDSKRITKFLEYLSKSHKVSGTVTSEENTWIMYFYDENNELIQKIWMWESGYFGFVYDKEYGLYDEIKKIKDTILLDR